VAAATVSLVAACTFGGTSTAGGGRQAIALLLPEAKTARYETQDRPRFERRVRERSCSLSIPFASWD
jgi:D-xylose transport system substrate-binding protein